MVLISGSANVRSLHPWRLDLFGPNNTARLSIPKNYKRIVKRRRNTVTRNYRAGRMYAILHDGRVAMVLKWWNPANIPSKRSSSFRRKCNIFAELRVLKWWNPDYIHSKRSSSFRRKCNIFAELRVLKWWNPAYILSKRSSSC